METRTEYAVRYTGRQYGKPAVLVETPLDPTDRAAAIFKLEHVVGVQRESGIAVDAELVTRTITVTDWNLELPTWDQMDDLDKGSALMHISKCDSEGNEYATENYPAAFFTHPALTALSDEAASEFAREVTGYNDDGDDVWRKLGDEFDRLYDLACAADRARYEAARNGS